VAALHVTDDPVAAVRETDAWPVGVVPEREDERYLGYEPETVADIAANTDADAVLVKADGARARLFKAPGADEPRIPVAADTVVPVASVHAVGDPLTEESVHRPERVAALTDRERGDAIRPADVATVLAHEEGGLKSVPEVRRSFRCSTWWTTTCSGRRRRTWPTPCYPGATGSSAWCSRGCSPTTPWSPSATEP
jgi:probable selenium-dependent hydroxylase accessory protein YqeC